MPRQPTYEPARLRALWREAVSDTRHTLRALERVSHSRDALWLLERVRLVAAEGGRSWAALHALRELETHAVNLRNRANEAAHEAAEAAWRARATLDSRGYSTGGHRLDDGRPFPVLTLRPSCAAARTARASARERAQLPLPFECRTASRGQKRHA